MWPCQASFWQGASSFSTFFSWVRASFLSYQWKHADTEIFGTQKQEKKLPPILGLVIRLIDYLTFSWVQCSKNFCACLYEAQYDCLLCITNTSLLYISGIEFPTPVTFFFFFFCCALLLTFQAFFLGKSKYDIITLWFYFSFTRNFLLPKNGLHVFSDKNLWLWRQITGRSCLFCNSTIFCIKPPPPPRPLFLFRN